MTTPSEDSCSLLSLLVLSLFFLPKILSYEEVYPFVLPQPSLFGLKAMSVECKLSVGDGVVSVGEEEASLEQVRRVVVARAMKLVRFANWRIINVVGW